jgi:RNA polymerase sigma-70 factor (ECF subfamily)
MVNKKKTIQSIALDFLQERNNETFTKIVNRLKPGLLSHVYKYVNDIYLSKEVVAKTFIAIWEKIDQYDQKYNFSTWVYAIAKNEALGQLRVKKKFLSHDKMTEEHSRVLMSFNPTFNMDLEFYGPTGEEITYCLYDKTIEKIHSLNEPYKTVMIEREINQRRLQDIAYKLNWNLSTVKTRLRKARKEVALAVKETHHELLESYYEKENL